MGDDFVFHKDASRSATQDMIDSFKTQQADSGQQAVTALVTCVRRSRSELSQYGVVAVKKHNGRSQLIDLIEKPTPGNEPSNLTNISKYILTPQIFDIIENQSPNPQNNELYLTDSILQLSKTSPVLVHEPEGIYLDGGNIMSWLEANLTIAWHDPKLKPQLAKIWDNLTHQR